MSFIGIGNEPVTISFVIFIGSRGYKRAPLAPTVGGCGH